MSIALHPTEARLLTALRRRDDRTGMLAWHAGLAPTHAHAILTRLAEARLVERITPDGVRPVRWRITPKGGDTLNSHEAKARVQVEPKTSGGHA